MTPEQAQQCIAERRAFYALPIWQQRRIRFARSARYALTGWHFSGRAPRRGSLLDTAGYLLRAPTFIAFTAALAGACVFFAASGWAAAFAFVQGFIALAVVAVQLRDCEE